MNNIIQRTGFDKQNNKGCAIGCTINNYSHSQFEIELGIPKILAITEDNLFENLPVKESKSFPLEFLSAVPVGVNLYNVYPSLIYWQLTDSEFGIINIVKNEDDKKFIEKTSVLYKDFYEGKTRYEEFIKIDTDFKSYLFYKAFNTNSILAPKYKSYIDFTIQRYDIASLAYMYLYKNKKDVHYRIHRESSVDPSNFEVFLNATRKKLMQILNNTR